MKCIAKLTALALFLAAGAHARADTITFGSFTDTSPGKWSYNAGSLSATNDTAFFFGFPIPLEILNYIGLVTYDINAIAVGAATYSGGVIRQELDGQMTFKSGSTTVLDILFAGALITGLPNSHSTGVTADTQLTGNVISYYSDPSIQTAPFFSPSSFSIALTQTPGLAIDGSNLANFTATATGSFSTSSEPSGSVPTPLPPPAPAALALLTLVAAGRLARGQRRPAVAQAQ